MSVEPLKTWDDILKPDERWHWFNLSLEDHYRLISSIEVNDAAPEVVRQQFENARNAWLYAHFAYRLLTVALTTVHTACEMAVRERARQEQVRGWEKKRLFELLDIAITNRWLVDSGFVAASRPDELWDEDRSILLQFGSADIGPYVEPTDDQAHAKVVVRVIRELRNALSHGELLLMPNISPAFRASADLINQLFPQG